MAHNNVLNLNLLFKHLTGMQSHALLLADLSAANRLEKLRAFLPVSFIELLEKKSNSYQSWLLNDNRQMANALFRDFHKLLQEDSYGLLHETYQLAESQFENFPAEQLKELQELLEPFLQHTEFVSNKTYYNYFSFYIQISPVHALAKLILLLCLGDYAGKDLILLFPAFELNSIKHSSDLHPHNLFMGESERQYQLALFCYKNGDHAEAFHLFQELADQYNDPEARYQLGKMLLLGDGCSDKPDREQLAFDCFRRNKEHLESIYELYLCYLNGIGTNKVYRRAKECLEKASRLDVLAANRDLGMAYYKGHPQLQYEEDREKAYHLFLKGACVDAPEKGDAACQYMLGWYAEQKSGYPDEIAQNWYRQAAKKGLVRAKQRLLDMTASDKLQTGTKQHCSNRNLSSKNSNGSTPESLLCFFNFYSAETLNFIRSLPADAHCRLIFVLPITDCEKLPYIRQTIDSAIAANQSGKHGCASRDVSYYSGNMADAVRAYLSLEHINTIMAELPEIIFYLFHSDQKQNLSDALLLLEALKPLQKHHADIANYLAEAIDVYLLSEFENTESIIDSTINSMQKTYIRVQICNPNADASRYLLYKKPLFLPCIGENGANDINVIIIGNNRCIPKLIQNAIATGFCGEKRKFRITVFSQEESSGHSDHVQKSENMATAMELQFRHLCPGIFRYPELFDPEIHFFSFTYIDTLCGLLSYSYASFSESDKKAAELLCQGNYFIVAFEDSLYTIDIATQLRASLLKYDPTFSRTPLIAAYCPDDILTCQTSKLIVGNMEYGFEWFNNYDIYCFGSYTDLYSYHALRYNVLRNRGLQLHLSYCEDLNDPIAVSNAYQAYYSRSYNRDSSETGILNLTYRIFAAGITLPNPDDYGIPEEECKLASSYDTWLEDPTHLETAVKLEHQRWNLFMLSRGFEPATLTQMSTYLHKGNPTHVLHIAKLHPFICKWEDLIDEQEGVQFHLNQIMKTLRPDMKPMNIRKVDTKFVTETARLLSLTVDVR